MIAAYMKVFRKRLFTRRTAITALFLALIASQISSFAYQRIEQPKRRIELLESIQLQLNGTESRLSDLQRQGLTLQEQNNELQHLSICLLQLIKGENFTDRAECQRKVDEFAGNQTRNSTTVIVPQPQANPTPQISAPTQLSQPSQPMQSGLLGSLGNLVGGLLR